VRGDEVPAVTRFGQIPLNGPEAMFEARTKARRVAVEMGLDDMASTRLSTAVSQAVRWTLRHDSAGILEIGLDSRGAHDYLTFSITTGTPMPEPAFLGHFVDSLSRTEDTMTACVRLVGPRVDDRSVANACAIVREKSRDELLAEIQAKNEALEASKDVLEQTVQERTSELAIALEQIENSETIIERWLPDGTITAMNNFGLELFGYEESEIVGRNAFDTIVPDDDAVHAMWIEAGELLGDSPEQNSESELQCRKKDGTPLWVAFRNRPIFDADGQVTEVLSIGIDMTERRELEARLQAANLRMEGELNIGRDIQMSMLPRSFPAFPDRDDFVVFATLEPAREVGGDLFDFFLIDEDHLCFLVGDVSDKGVPAALFMAVTKTAIKSQAVLDPDTASILTHVNDELAENNETSMFVTLFVAILDTRTGNMTYTNAGHNPPYIKKADGSIVTVDARHGPVAGAIEGIAFGSSQLTLDPGDIAILYTDGVTEAMNIDHDQYTDAGLKSLLEDSARVSAEEFVALINREVALHRGEAEQSDDITVLAMTYRGPDPTAEHLELTIPATLGAIAEVLESFERFATEHSLDDMVRRQTLLVLDDLLNNVASYAYDEEEGPDDQTGTISIHAELTPSRLVLTISDEGVPFNPFGLNAPDVQLSLEERDIGGLGIHLVRTVMDEVGYRRRAGRNVVTVTKWLEPAPNGNPASGSE
jgi:sigma-B regulation protein RsbU (phosphoserine phosphatase)